MNEINDTKTSRQNDQIKFFLGGALILAVAGAFFFFRGSPAPEPQDLPPQLKQEEEHAAVLAHMEQDLAKERLRSQREYRSYVEVRIREHDARLSLAKKELAESVAEYFETKKDNIPEYAVEALTWRNRWTAFWDEDEYQDILEDLFSENVMSSTDMGDSLTAEVEKYLKSVAKEELALADDVRVKMNALPALGLEAKLDQDSFNSLIAAHIQRTTTNVKKSSQKVAVVGGFALAAVAVFGIPAAVGEGTTVAGGSTVTKGAAFVIPPALGKAIATWVLRNVDDLIDSMIITEDEVESSALRLLDDLKYTLMKGAEGPWEEYNDLAEIAADATDDMKMRNATIRMNEMRNSGMLGLLAILDLIQERNIESKSEILRSLSDGQE